MLHTLVKGGEKALSDHELYRGFDIYYFISQQLEELNNQKSLIDFTRLHSSNPEELTFQDPMLAPTMGLSKAWISWHRLRRIGETNKGLSRRIKEIESFHASFRLKDHSLAVS